MTLPMSHLPLNPHRTVPWKPFLVFDFSHVEEWEHVNECPASQAIRDLAKDAHFSLTLCRVLSHELLNWGAVSSWENSSLRLEGIKGMRILLTISQTLSGGWPTSHQDTLPVDPPMTHKIPHFSACFIAHPLPPCGWLPVCIPVTFGGSFGR